MGAATSFGRTAIAPAAPARYRASVSRGVAAASRSQVGIRVLAIRKQCVGIPDARIGANIYHDTTLARKDGYTPQITKWNEIRPGNVLIIRPTDLGGAYGIPRSAIQPYAPTPKSPGRR